MIVAAYFRIVSAILAWWRVAAYLIEEAFGSKSWASYLVPVIMFPGEKKKPLIVPGFGEPGVERAAAGCIGLVVCILGWLG